MKVGKANTCKLISSQLFVELKSVYNFEEKNPLTAPKIGYNIHKVYSNCQLSRVPKVELGRVSHMAEHTRQKSWMPWPIRAQKTVVLAGLRKTSPDSFFHPTSRINFDSGFFFEIYPAAFLTLYYYLFLYNFRIFLKAIPSLSIADCKISPKTHVHPNTTAKQTNIWVHSTYGLPNSR